LHLQVFGRRHPFAVAAREARRYAACALTERRVRKVACAERGFALPRRSDLQLPDFLPYLVNRVGAALVARFTDEALRQHGLTIADWRVLVAISAGSGRRQIDLAELTSIDASTLSRLITRLEKNRLVTRTRSATSNREVVVRLTPKAKAIVAGLVPVARALERTAAGGLSRRQLADLKVLLRRVYGNLVPDR
jgi:DNA-binding MarR family transcriptional regulator